MTGGPRTHDSTVALPHVDEPRVVVDADAATTWAALTDVLGHSFGGNARAKGAALLGCEHTRPNATPFPGQGAVVPGFVARTSEAPRLLELTGRHRFSTYSLTFRLDDVAGATVVRAETRAAFPALSGRLYRAAVIGSGAHGRLMASMLGSIKRRAERHAAPAA